MKIPDGMSTGAPAFFPDDFVGRTIVAVHEIEDGTGGERCEVLLLLDTGESCLISCDPIVHDEDGVKLPPEQWGKAGWEVVLYDTTHTDAGKAARDAAQ